MKRQVPHWEKIFAKHVSFKGLISNIVKELLKFNNTDNQIKNGHKTGTDTSRPSV